MTWVIMFLICYIRKWGNSIYENVVRGGCQITKVLIPCLGKTFRLTGTFLSKPFLAPRTTAFFRSVVRECLHNIIYKNLVGKVVSVTTDGFITDIPDLESKLFNLKPSEIPLLSLYQNLRSDLSNKAETLGIKQSGVAGVSWITRGPLGVRKEGEVE